MKKYKLIKTYPNSPKLGCVVLDVNPNNGATDAYFSENWGELNNKGGFFIARHHKCEENPEFWEEVKEVEKLCVPVGTKFTYKGGGTVYTIERYDTSKSFAFISWGYERVSYHVSMLNKLFSEGNWVVYVEKPVLFVTEDGKEIKEGDKYCYVPKCNNTLIFSTVCSSNNGVLLDIIRFSTREAAQEYIDMNKPIYSKKQAIQMMQKADRALSGIEEEDGAYVNFLL